MSREASLFARTPTPDVAPGDAWRSAGATHAGLVRRSNQDAWMTGPGLFAVADGMGGHLHGDLASRLIVEELGRLGASGPLSLRIAEAEAAIRRARARLCAVPGAAEDGSGSTVAILLVAGAEAALLWAGDSRIYRKRTGGLEQLTHDHSVVQQLLDAGALSRDEASIHPLRNRLTRAVGTSIEIELDQLRIEAEPGDRFLLCTDGLHGPVPEAELEAVSAGNPLAVAVEALIAAALARGARDNVTAVLAEAPSTTPRPRPPSDDITALGPQPKRR